MPKIKLNDGTNIYESEDLSMGIARPRIAFSLQPTTRGWSSVNRSSSSGIVASVKWNNVVYAIPNGGGTMTSTIDGTTWVNVDT
ncbi:hypothetical protein FACS189465_3360 [Clostridia bacterium]|nr:hypothetical protein FACS189465_3360 [Clostridia bacterium]